MPFFYKPQDVDIVEKWTVFFHNKWKKQLILRNYAFGMWIFLWKTFSATISLPLEKSLT